MTSPPNATNNTITIVVTPWSIIAFTGIPSFNSVILSGSNPFGHPAISCFNGAKVNVKNAPAMDRTIEIPTILAVQFPIFIHIDSVAPKAAPI